MNREGDRMIDSTNIQEISLEQALIEMAETVLSLLLGIRFQIHLHPASSSMNSMVFGNVRTVCLRWKQREGVLHILSSGHLFEKLFAHENFDHSKEWTENVQKYVDHFSKQFSLRMSILFSEVWELEKTELKSSFESLDVKSVWRYYYVSVGDQYLSDMAVGIGSDLYRQWRDQWKQNRRRRKLVKTQFFPHLESSPAGE
jgi:hypothetical protein